MSRLLDYPAIGRVLDAVRQAGLEPPSAAWPAAHGANDLDATSGARRWRAELSQDISWAYTLHAIGPHLASDAKARSRTKGLTDTTRLANRLLALITDEKLPLAGDLARHFDPREGESIHTALAGLRSIAIAASQEAARRRSAGIADKAILPEANDGAPKAGTTVDFVARIAEVFERSFGTAVTISHDTAREPGGPFLAFTMSLISEMKVLGITPPVGETSGAIEQAFKRGRRLSDKPSDK